MKKWIVLVLGLSSAVLAASAATRLYRIHHRWLLWTPLQAEVWVWPVGEPNNIEYHRVIPQWLDPNCRELHVDVFMPKEHTEIDRVIRLEFTCRMIDMKEFAKE